MKTSLKQIAAGTFIALILLVGNVKAEGTEIKASSHDLIKTTETTLELESWMTNESVWNNNSIKIMDFAQETEAEMELESWMTNHDSWNLNNSVVEEFEAEMELENWMTDDKTWNTFNNNIESELTVESWMVDNNIWE